MFLGRNLDYNMQEKDGVVDAVSSKADGHCLIETKLDIHVHCTCIFSSYFFTLSLNKIC